MIEKSCGLVFKHTCVCEVAFSSFFISFVLSFSFLFFRSSVLSFHLRSLFVRSFVIHTFVRSFVIHTHVHTYTFIPLRHMQFYIFLKKLSLDHHKSIFTNIHPSIHSQSQSYLTQSYPTQWSFLSRRPTSHFPSRLRVTTPFFPKKKNRVNYFTTWGQLSGR